MRWIVLLLLVAAGGLWYFRGSPAPSAASSGAGKARPAVASAASASESGAYEDIFFLREPVDVSSTPWNGILNAGTPVRKVRQDGGKVIIETGNGRITVDADKLTHDAKLGHQVNDTLSRPPGLGAPAANGPPPPSPTLPTGSSGANPLVPPPAASH